MAIAVLMLPAVDVTASQNDQTHKILHISSSSEQYNLTPYIEYLEDKTGSLTINDVSSSAMNHKFLKTGDKTINFGMSKSTFWLRCYVTNQDTNHRWLLDTGRVFLTSSQLYVRPLNSKTGEWNLQKSGDALHTGSANKANPTYHLPILNRETIVCYLRIHSYTSLFLPLTISTENYYMNKSTIRTLMFGIYYGLIFALAVYNIFLYFSLRDKSYLWYVIYIIMLAIYFMGVNGLTLTYLSAGNPYAAGMLINFTLGTALICAAQFTRSFLMTEKNSKTADKMLLLSILMTVILVIAGMLIDFHILNILYTILGPIIGSIIIGAGISCFYSGFKSAKFLLIAWIPYMIGAIIYTAILRGSLPFTFAGYYSFQAGSALEVLLLSLALADRINQLQKDREEGQIREQHYQELASIDTLTGLYNAGYFRQQISSIIQRSELLNIPLSLIMMDADNFKTINDSYGHLVGDKILAMIGKDIQASVRHSDFPCRYGGEEFAILLPGSNTSDALDVAERIRTALRSHVKIPILDKEVEITLSIGVAVHNPGENANEFLSKADQMLYTAKKQGKNQIVHNLSKKLSTG
ncbi:MAG: sensor domain-containing diguanylate cyclase [Armatimonadota bacterium]